ncbi:hypothetical protein E2562_006088 [Oryza meyeriana var. granulata]|uniref:RING-type E3 ubiquitin transferase n=1 Tax=Oryza meyeriana var. granulata TaxID=110450 RepID=A0A6G1EVL7_9ORYZ|nr:hypothetical protein E2562_006088 [Oryza meyeriana var. granulata]
MAAAAEEKVLVALPANTKAGRSTLSWALGHFRDTGATVVVAHVHVPPQMIPVMGVKFHASKLNPEQVSLFRMAEHGKVNKLLDSYVNQCLRMKMKCEKLVIENENVVAGLLELINLHGITKLVISAAPDRNYSRKMDKPTSRTATEIMQRAGPSCKIWFVCKEQLICTSAKEVETAPVHTSFIPDIGHNVLQLSPHQEQDDNSELELGFYDEIKEACKAAENLMKRALTESSRRQKADEELVSSLQKAKEYEELYLEEVERRKELEEALLKASKEIAKLKQERDLAKNHHNTIMEEPQEEITDNLNLQQRIVDMKGDLGSSGQVILQEYLDHDNCVRELKELLSQRKLTAFSPSSVMQSPFDEDCCIPSYFICPIVQEVMREPCIAADGFTYETDAIRGWIDGGHKVSPITGQPLQHQELIPNLSLRSVIQDHARRKRYSFS